MQGKVTGVRLGQPQKDRYFQNVPSTAGHCGQGVENWRERFGLQSDKESLSSLLVFMTATIKRTWYSARTE